MQRCRNPTTQKAREPYPEYLSVSTTTLLLRNTRFEKKIELLHPERLVDTQYGSSRREPSASGCRTVALTYLSRVHFRREWFGKHRLATYR